MDQENSHEQLYIRNIHTSKEMHISVEINTDELRGIALGPGENWTWVVLTSTKDPNQYETGYN